jgi:SNF family Na+-dependent transporter
VFQISLLSPEYAEDELRLVVNHRQTGRRERLNISDWTVDSVHATLGTYVVSLFWVSPAQFAPQIGLSATAMLRLIAFQFALVSILPNLAYFPVLDGFIVGSTIIVFLALVEAVAAVFLVSREKTQLALRMDKISRAAFPTAFGLLVPFVFTR